MSREQIHVGAKQDIPVLHEYRASVFQMSHIIVFFLHERLNGEKAHWDQFLVSDNQESRAVKFFFG